MSKKDKSNHFNNLYKNCEKNNDIRNVYRTTKEQLGWETTGPQTALIENGVLITKPKDIADTQIKYVH